MNPDHASLVVPPPDTAVAAGGHESSSLATLLPQPAPWWSIKPAEHSDTGTRPQESVASIAQRMAALHAWEFDNVPMLRRRASAEVFFAVWALSGQSHDAGFTAKAVLAHARISDRAARFALRALLDDGWIQRCRNGRGDADGRLRPYRPTARLKGLLVEYEARIAATL